MAPCFEASRTRYLAERHREQWHLAGPEALTGSCIGKAPVHARRYDLAAAPP
jgi:DNA polymerase III psi subunit